MAEETEIVNYLFKRLYQLGIRSVHGVPGDFNLTALDYLDPAGLNWVGNCSELNAGYAADGYARINGISALITTFGVGELSAVPAIAGSYSERVSVVHIVGIPSTKSEKHGLPVHHTFADGNYAVFKNISKNISQVCVTLDDVRVAGKEIDRVLRECYLSARPVYIALPVDMVLSKTPAKDLDTPIDLTVPRNHPDTETEAVEAIQKTLYSSNNAIVLVDVGAMRYRVLKEVQEFIDQSRLPVFLTPMSRGAINEASSQFRGVYNGDASGPEIQQEIQSADLIISIGPLNSDFNTGGFTRHTKIKNTIEFQFDCTKVGYATYLDVGMKWVLQRILDSVDFRKIQHPETAVTEVEKPADEEGKVTEPFDREVTHKWFWSHIGDWLQEGDVVIAETGTAMFGIMDTRFPKGVTAITQILWGSIGFSVGACQGAALAIAQSEKPTRRVILFVGDGSFQLTGNEVSTMIRHGLKPIIVVINNDGYSIERMIHGPEMSYNDIQPWKYRKFLKAFGAKKGGYKNHVVRTQSECYGLFNKGNEFSKANVIQAIELFMPKMDGPHGLWSTLESLTKFYAKL
ncbi:Pyruvate decarboxylase 1 [Arthrobotrys musiformis]|uniref:Pyruvate decarboxylase n=1 Tax=Arthrobotrys musiformis TaxID=47236 RepID=A0AAV9WAN6_9PEZI